MKRNIYVIDTSGFIKGMGYADGAMITVPGVVDELIDSLSRLRFDLLLEGGLTVESPSKNSIERVRSAAVSTGDMSVLSATDIDILAKALELCTKSTVILITDDYAVQNVAAWLGIKYITAGSEGIARTIRWELKCRGCGAVVKSGSECPVCGSEVKRLRTRG